MKTLEEWAKFEWENPLIKTGEFIKMIQEDAYKEGYNKAMDFYMKSIEKMNDKFNRE